MKILLVSLHHVEYTVELARSLSYNHNLQLVLSIPKVAQTLNKDLDRLLGGRASYTLLEKYAGRNPKILRNFIVILKLLNSFRPDIIHIQESADLANLAFFVWAVPLVVTVHDVNFHPGGEGRYLRRGLHKCVCRYINGKIIVHGKRLKNELLEGTGRSSHDVFTIPHGCLFSFDSASPNTTEEEEHSILFFGRIQEYKGLRYLIEAIPLVTEKISNFKVIIAGTGKDLAKHRNLLKGNPHFEVHDRFIPTAEVHCFFRRCSLVVLPYIEASQSGVVAMAFAFGKPVVATDVGSLGEMVEDGKTGVLVPPCDVKKLADAIIYLLQCKDIRKKMGVEALRAAKNTFSWDRIARLTEQVYAEACK